MCPGRPAPPSLLSGAQNLARVPVLPPQEGVWEGASLTLCRDQCPEWGWWWQGVLGDPRWASSGLLPCDGSCPRNARRKAIWASREAARCCPRAQPECVGLRDWSPPPSPRDCASLSEGITRVQVHPAENRGLLTAEPGSTSFHCQTGSFPPRSPPPSQEASCREHSPPTPPVGRGPGRSSRQGQGTQRGGGATQGRVWSRPLSSLPPTMSHIPSPTPGFALWAAASGKPLGYRTGESRPLCAIGAFLRVPAQGTGQEGALGESPARVPPASSSPPGVASWTERASDESA